MIKVAKYTHIAERIVIVDGINGSGKSVLFPVIGSLDKVEKVRMEPIYEYLSVLFYLKKIDLDAAISLMSIYADTAIYHQMISREVNLRIRDDSGLLNNPKRMQYIVRLFFKDGEEAMKRINDFSPILHLMTHQIFSTINLAFESFNARLRVVLMVRHPLYMIDHWLSYIDRYGTDPREMSICLDYKGKVIPWFAHGWEEKYVSLSSLDKVIYSIDWLVRRSDEVYAQLRQEQKKQVIIIPFERFVVEPWKYVEALENLLGTVTTSVTGRALKRQRCPRPNLMFGRGHKEYGWENGKPAEDDLNDFKRRKSFVIENASEESIKILNVLCGEYEEKYDLHRQSPWSLLT